MSWTGYEETTLAEEIENNGFFPDLSLGDFIRDYRIPVEYEQESLKHHLTMSMLDVNKQLKTRVELWTQSGADTLSEVEQETLGSVKALVEHYKRACFTSAKARMLKLFESMVQKAEAENSAKSSDDTYQYWKGISQLSLAELKGKASSYQARLC